MDSNILPEKTSKAKPNNGILGYFQKNSRPTSAPTCNNIQSEASHEIPAKKENEASPEIDKENKSKLVVKMKPRGVKKKRKKIEMQEPSSDEELEEIFNENKKKKLRIGPTVAVASPTSSEQDLDIEKIVTVPKHNTINVNDIKEQDQPGPSKENPEKPRQTINSFFRVVSKEERLKKVEKDNSLVEVKVLIHESPENRKSESMRETSKKLNGPKLSKKSKKSRKSNVALPATETDKIELIEVDEIVENVEEKPVDNENQNKDKNVEEIDLEANDNLDDVSQKISSNLFKTRRKKVENSVPCKSAEDSDDSVSMESLENSPMKNLGSATSSPIEKVARLELPADGEKSERNEQSESASKIEGKQNAFVTLMKNSRRSFEPEENLTVVPKSPKDEKLKNMLSVFQSIESDDEACDSEVRNIVNSKKRKLKKKKKLKKSDSNEASDDCSDDEKAEDVYDVKCKTTMGKFHLSKFKEEGKGQCIEVDGVWMTAQQFESFSGSRAKKYKVSLSINKTPFGKFLEERNIRTPSRSKSRSGRLSTLSNNSGRSTPSIDFTNTPEDQTQLKTKNKKKEPSASTASPENPEVRILKEKESDVLIETPKSSKTSRTKMRKGLDGSTTLSLPLQEDPAVTESPSAGRRSRRIASKSEVFDEKKKLQEEQERQLEESDRKIELERKIRNSAVAKQRKLLSLQSSQSEELSDTECQIVAVNSPSRKKTEKVASIFTRTKKIPPPAEDPAVVAARKAFLMSSAPETLRTAMSREGDSCEGGERGVVWPGPSSLPSHTGQAQINLTSRPGHWSYSAVKPFSPPTTLQSTPLLNISDQASVPNTSRNVERMTEAGVLATAQSLIKAKTSLSVKMLNSLIERKVEAEMFEREAREKNLSVSEVEKKRIRGNRRRSRRSLEMKSEAEAGRYEVDRGSGLLWTSKYQPRCGADILGNSAGVAGLREWLSTWVGAGAARQNSDLASDLTSDLTSDPTDSEYEYDVDKKTFDIQVADNTALIVGNTGTGKTATVYALAAELGFKVLEVNASSNRTGKQILSMLSEATQSQQVRGEEEKKKFFFSQKKLQDTNTSSKKLKKALILLEDIDLVFDDFDEGFYSAVNTLSQTSKRPIVMTVSQMTWMLQGVRSVGERVLKFTPREFLFRDVDEEELTRHLQTIALVEGYHIASSELKSKGIMKSCGVRQAMLQLQLYCSSGLDVIDCQMEAEEVGDSEETEQDLQQWFRHLDSRTRRGGLVTPASGVRSGPTSPQYNSEDWWESLPGTKTAPPSRLMRYPLTELDRASHKFKRIDPLKNSELFDTEESDEEKDIEQEGEDKSELEGRQPAQISKEERTKNYQSLSQLSSHLDLVSQWCPAKDAIPWHVMNPHPKGGLSQELDESVRSVEEDRLDLQASYSGSILSLSSALNRPASDYQLLHSDWRQNRTKVWNSQKDTFFCGLVDIFLVDRRSRLDLLTGLRSMARGEEVRRIQSSQDRRGSRFRHYFAQNEVDLEEETIHCLCNSLQD